MTEQKVINVDGRDFRVQLVGEGEPGYLRRMMALANLRQATVESFSVKTLEDMITFLASVVEPADGGDRREALLDLSESGLLSLIEQLNQRDLAPKEQTASPS